MMLGTLRNSARHAFAALIFACCSLAFAPPANDNTPRALAPRTVRPYLDAFKAHPDSLRNQFIRIPFSDTADLAVLSRESFENIQAFEFPDSILCIVFYSISDIGLLQLNQPSGRLVGYNLFNKDIMGMSGLIDYNRVFCRIDYEEPDHWSLSTFFAYAPDDCTTAFMICGYSPGATGVAAFGREPYGTFNDCADTTNDE